MVLCVRAASGCYMLGLLFVGLFYPPIIFYHCLDGACQSVSQSALGAWWSVDNKESCHLNKKLYSFFWSDHCNHLNKSTQECCQLSDSAHSRLITSRTLCTWKSTQSNNVCVTPRKNMNSYLKIKCLLNALFFIVWGWEHMSMFEQDCPFEDGLAHLFVHCQPICRWNGWCSLNQFKKHCKLEGAEGQDLSSWTRNPQELRVFPTQKAGPKFSPVVVFSTPK